MSAVRQLDAAELEALLGASTCKRLANRNRGGKNGYKGTRYENLFGGRLSQVVVL